MNFIKGLPRPLVNFFLEVLDRENLAVISYNDAESRKIADLIHESKQETKMWLGTKEAYQICMAVKVTSKLKGDIVEVGVYKGGSACLVCKVKGSKTLHFFDAFEDTSNAETVARAQTSSSWPSTTDNTTHNLIINVLAIHLLSAVFATPLTV